ncbi:hypothetical protein L484_015649 [Morus notabilis]|uniref:Uncharacterized protein n=1 Tax=Morus notabilis TaxID=981085 RepID=W9QY47_9ROSA|nr:hypothetical protein L484_015649 [Morus notabilis]
MGNMRKKKDIGGIEHEVITMIMELESYFKQVAQRLSEMKQYKDSGSLGFGELGHLNIVEEETRKAQETVCEDLSKLMKEQPDPQQNPKIRNATRRMYTSRDMKFAMAKIKMSMAGLQGVQETLDLLEERLRKYNVPKLDAIDRSKSTESFDQYLERLREFMQVTWKDKAEKCRRKEHRSLTGWIVKLEESEDPEKRITFDALRVVLNDIGSKISCFLIKYLLIVSVSVDKEEMTAKLFEVESMIRCLHIEENSIVVNTFVTVVKLFDRMMRTMMNPTTKIDMTKKRDSQIEKENEVLHLIIIEVLRLEVGFCHPDLPMMLSNEVFMAMGQHLMDNVFVEKLDGLRAKIDGLKKTEFLSDGDKDSMGKTFEQALTLVVKEIWNQLDLKPRT